MKKKYRYALRNKEKLSSSFGEEYLKRNLLDSLDRFFSEERDLQEWVAMVGLTHPKYDILAINDTTNVDYMQVFAIIEIKYDVVRLAYIERIKG